MAIFYLLPPRPLVGEQIRALFPGLAGPAEPWAGLADAVADVISRQAEVFVVYREDLPPDEEPTRALRDGFGAQAGDEVVEIRPGNRQGEWTAQRRWLGEAA